MSKHTGKDFETLGDAAARLLGGLERRRKKASEGLDNSSEQIGRADLTGFDLGDFPAMDDITQISPDTDERDAPEDRAAGATLRGLETASRMVRVGHRRSVVYVTFSGAAVIAANDGHPITCPRLVNFERGDGDRFFST